jgi:predicted N-formylglutamate amidohydrolase
MSILVIADHASNAVPAGVDLGVDAARMREHIAWDIGTAALARGLAGRLRATALMAEWSRLVVDVNRAPDEAIPLASDGVTIPGNAALGAAERAARIAAWHEPYHAQLAAMLAGVRLIVSLHSFTPELDSRPEEARPWAAGLLYNRDDRAAAIALRELAADGLTVGDNLPYSGAVYGYTTDRHAETNGVPYLTFEVRQDLLAGAVEEWVARLERVVRVVMAEMRLELETVTE